MSEEYRTVRVHDLISGFVVTALSLVVFACSGASSEVDEQEAERRAARQGATKIHRLAANRVGVPVTGGKALAKSKSDKPKDYWKPISFDRTNFEEVRTFVRQRYIDPQVDNHRAYAQAASFALVSDEKQQYLVLPESFYKLRKGHKDEEGKLSGKVTKLRPSDPFVILEVVKKKKKKKNKRLTDDQIRELWRKQKVRNGLLDVAWKRAKFGAREFERVMDFIAIHLGKDPKWSMKRAWIMAAQGYLFSLDPHSAMMPKKAWEDSTREATDASFEGIGAILTRRPDSEYTIVESPIEGQPAVKAGLRAGDMIMKVDGHDIKGEMLTKVVKRIRGKKGTVVVLTVQRVGFPKPLRIPIVRAHIDIKNVSGRFVPHYKGIATVKLTGFVPTTTRKMRQMIEGFKTAAGKAGFRGLILDLRNNSGGLLKQGIYVADSFVKKGVIVSVRSRGGRNDVDQATKSGWDMPLVVLVNHGSASASEIVASAVQENARGLVIGDRTFGKASVQTLYTPISTNEYFIKLTVARYYSPRGRTLQVVGVTPDILVPPTYGGKMPLGFREENLSHHLPPIVSKAPKINAAYAAKIKACVKAKGKAKTLHNKNPNPAIKFDYQLMYAADALECMRRTKRQGKRN